jgi:hypothetical protein
MIMLLVLSEVSSTSHKHSFIFAASRCRLHEACSCCIHVHRHTQYLCLLFDTMLCCTVHCRMLYVQGVNGPLSSQFNPTAHATLHLCLAPDQEVHTAIKALKQHCIAVRLQLMRRNTSTTLYYQRVLVHDSVRLIIIVAFARTTACKY